MLGRAGRQQQRQQPACSALPAGPLCTAGPPCLTGPAHGTEGCPVSCVTLSQMQPRSTHPSGRPISPRSEKESGEINIPPRHHHHHHHQTTESIWGKKKSFPQQNRKSRKRTSLHRAGSTLLGDESEQPACFTFTGRGRGRQGVICNRSGVSSPNRGLDHLPSVLLASLGATSLRMPDCIEERHKSLYVRVSLGRSLTFTQTNEQTRGTASSRLIHLSVRGGQARRF